MTILLHSSATALRRGLTALCLGLLSAVALPVAAQTVIDLNSGGVRAKTVDDYREEKGLKERAEADSLAYIDHLTRAFNALHDDSLARAERLFNLALKTRPDAPGNYIVRYSLGQICLAQGRYREATARFDEVLKTRPDAAEARYNRAVCYYETGSYRPALADCAALIDGGIDNALMTKVLFLRSAVYTKSHQADRAKLDLEAILRLDPTNESAALLLASTLEELGQPQAALDHLTRFVEAHPENVDGLVARAELRLRLALPDMARTDYDAAIRLQPDRADLYVGRAKACISLGAGAAARKDLDKAVTLGQTRGELTELYKQTR